VPVHDLGAALGAMNFVRTLVATIMIAIFGAIVLAERSAPAPARSARAFLAARRLRLSAPSSSPLPPRWRRRSLPCFCSRKSRWRTRNRRRAI